MMEKTAILYVGNHKEIQETVVRLINNRPDWRGKGVFDVTEAMDALRKASYHIVLLGCGIEREAEGQLRAMLAAQFPTLHVIQHYGGGSGLLFNEITEALQRVPAHG